MEHHHLLPFPLLLSSDAIRRQFPILGHMIDGHPLIYVDCASTAQKPQTVIDAITSYYETQNGNPHRGMHPLAERATNALEGARTRVQQFINTSRPEEIVFTKNCTEAINLVARSFGSTLKKGDRVVISMLEHHSNIVPWLQLKDEREIEIEWMECDTEGTLDQTQFEKLLKDGKTKLVALTAQSNVLGVRPPIQKMIERAHATGALVLIDAAQSIAHQKTDVQDLDADFLAFSGHKLYGPTGIGVLYGKRKLLETMPPFLGGGMMIREVHEDRFTPADIPAKFEAGTPPVAEAAGLRAAIDWIGQYEWNDIEAHEQELIDHAFKKLSQIDGLKILGPRNPSLMHGCVSFMIDGIHPHDLTDLLGKQGICLRAGHHCAQPLHRKLSVNASTRVSIGIYNTKEEIDQTVSAIQEIVNRLR